MFSPKTVLLALTVTVTCVWTDSVQAQEALTPDGYDVQARIMGPRGVWTWSTVERLETREEAEEYQAYLYFLVVMATTVDHRGDIDMVTWHKFVNEIDLPTGYSVDVRFRIVPYYEYSRFLGLPMLSTWRF